MTGLVILVPVLNRPLRAEPTLRTFEAATPGCRVLFIADPGDTEELNALRAAGANFIAPGGNYASKIRAGIEATDEPFVFTGADDLEPQVGWSEAASAAMSSGAEVVGINDLIDRTREHATHFLMTRAYAERPTIDGEPGPMFEGYFHWKVDDELIATARARGVYAYAPDAQVEHLHPFAKKAEWDATYEQGHRNRKHDRRLFERREALWTHLI